MNEIAIKEELERGIKNYTLTGDISLLNANQKIHLINQLCSMYDLQPAMRPLQIIEFQGKQTLYLTKTGCDQIANRLSLTREVVEETYIPEKKAVKIVVKVTDPNGRSESNVNFFSLAKYVMEKGVVICKELEGDEYCRAMKKAYSGAMRRATLGFVGYIEDTYEQEHTEAPQCVVEPEKQQTIISNVVSISSKNEPAAPIVEHVAEVITEQKEQPEAKKTTKKPTKKKEEEVAPAPAPTPAPEPTTALAQVLEEANKIYVDITNPDNKRELLTIIEELYPNWKQNDNPVLYQKIVDKMKATLQTKVELKKDIIKQYIEAVAF